MWGFTIIFGISRGLGTGDWKSFDFVGAGLADNSEITAEELTTKPALPEFVGIGDRS